MTVHVANNDIVDAVIAQVGLGNIGSHLSPLLARAMRGGRLLLIDPDVCDTSNLAGQQYLAQHVGRPKAAVMEETIKAISPGAEVQACVAAVEDLPLGALRADLIVACVDSREARQAINARAWRLNVPWLDTAVDAVTGLVRMNLYVPGTDNPCMVCSWSDEEWRNLSTRFSCAGEELAPSAAATAAPADLGALIAALACVQCRQVLAGDLSFAGHQLMLEVASHNQFVARLPCSDQCRQDHEPWIIENLARTPQDMTLADAFGLLAADTTRQPQQAGLAHESLPFVRRMRCTGCGEATAPVLQLSGRLHSSLHSCSRCGARCVVIGFDLDAEVSTAGLEPGWLQTTLADCGFLAGDVFTLRHDRTTRHFQLGGAISVPGDFDGQDHE